MDWSNKEKVLNEIQSTNNLHILIIIDWRLLEDRDVILAAVKKYGGFALRFASDELRNDIEIIYTAVKIHPWALVSSGPELRKNKDLVHYAVTQNHANNNFGSGYLLQHADESLRQNKEIVMAAVRSDGCALEFADESLRRDKEVVLTAVRLEGSALEFADESLKQDEEVVFNSFTNSLAALRIISDEILSRPRLIRKLCTIKLVNQSIIEKCKVVVSWNIPDSIVDDILTLLILCRRNNGT